MLYLTALSACKTFVALLKGLEALLKILSIAAGS
jgi:hypothetical protein